MRDFEFKAVDGKLIYVSESGMIGLNPIVSDVMSFPITGPDNLGKASYEIELDGDTFIIKVYYKRRTGMFDVSISGYEVYAEDKLLTTSYLYYGYARDNKRFGSNEFIYKGNWFCLMEGSPLSRDDAGLKQFPELNKSGIRLLKFSETRAPEINEIVKELDYDYKDERKAKIYIQKLWGEDKIDVQTIKW